MRYRITEYAFIIMCIITFQGIILADESPEIKHEINEIKLEQKAIREQLNKIESILLQRNNPVVPNINVKDVAFSLENNPIIGNKSAKLVLVEISDYQCPFCTRYFKETFPEIKKQYIDNGKIDYAVINKPLPNHPLAPKAAEASLCAMEQGRFWEMHSEIMSRRELLDKLSAFATILDLDIPKYENCLNTNKYANNVTKDLSTTNILGVKGVPAFILATKDSNDPTKYIGVNALMGAQTFARFQKEIDQALSNIPK
jgi:protein-disulfide isomerase